MTKCSISTCDRNAIAKGMCMAHYERVRKGRAIDLEAPLKKLVRGHTCVQPGCDEKHYSSGYCRKHWTRIQNHGDPNQGRAPRGQCTIAGCGNTLHGNGLCQKHYQRWKKYGDAEIVRLNNPTCLVQECGNKAQTRGLCQTHRTSLELQEKASRPCPEHCEICGKKETKKGVNRLCWDHDHKTGNFRGWICHNCNLLLGLCGDDAGILTAAVSYLTGSGKWPSKP